MNTKTKDLPVTTGESKPSYGYYSRELKQVFDTLDELKAAELALHEKEEAKLKLQEEKKSRAEEVENARLELEKVKEEACTRIDKVKAEESKKISEAEKKWLELRDKFAKDYGGYHYTYVNDNGKKYYAFGDLLDLFFKQF